MTALALTSADTARDKPVPCANGPVGSRRPREARPVLGNQAHLRQLAPVSVGLQAKLAIGAVDDPLEREADVAADTVMRMADPSLSLTGATPRLSRKCAACEDEEKGSVQREADGGGGADHAEAPEAVNSVLREAGRPLDPATHDFMASRFDADFSHVRVHDDAAAAASAREIGAHAYTVGDHLVFGQGRYDPAGEDGRRLIAHELAHTIQQGGGAPATLRRAPCRAKDQCGGPNPGDSGQFGERSEEKQRANTADLKAAPAGSKKATLLARNGLPATNIKALLAGAGVTTPPEVFGIFINPSIGESAGAQVDKCSAFPAPGPAGAPATKNCVQVPAELEDRAAILAAVKTPSESDRREILGIVSTCVHEMEHAQFDDTQSKTIAEPADCTLSTVVFHGKLTGDADVEFYLSEIAADTSEFPTFFDNHLKNPGVADHRLLFNEEREQALNKDESFAGNIRALQCVCSCVSVNDLVTQTVNLAMTGWTPEQRLAFLRAMTRILPSFWPPALQRADAP